MSTRVLRLRARLAPVRDVASAEVWAALEELFALAEVGESASAARSSAQSSAESGVARQNERGSVPSLRKLLHSILEERGEPMSVRDLVAAARAAGWRTESDAPGKVVLACLTRRGGFVRFDRGVYGLASQSPPTTPGAKTPEQAQSQAESVNLRGMLREILAERGGVASVSELASAARERGWVTTSSRARQLVGAVLRAGPEFVAVRRGVYALVGGPAAPATTPASSAPSAEPPVPATAASGAAPNQEAAGGSEGVRATAGLPPGVVRRTTRSSPPSQPHETPSALLEMTRLRDEIQRGSADTAMLAPQLIRLQLTAWIARARALRERAPGLPELDRATNEIASELAQACKLWWPGSVIAMKLDSKPAEIAAALGLAGPRMPSTWQEVADAVDARLAELWSEPDFDGGWRDGPWLCEDETQLENRLAFAERVLANLGTAPTDFPPKQARDIAVTPADVSALVLAARGVRWVRGIATDGTRWGRIIGRLRFLATQHPRLQRSALPRVLSVDYQPARGWLETEPG